MIGVTLLTQTHAVLQGRSKPACATEAAAKGFDLVVVACEMDPPKQASQIEDFVAQHVAAILVAPCDSNAVVPALAGPERAGIPVFTADIAAHGGKVVSHVASDNVQGGRLAAEALAGFMGGKGKVIIIDHPTVASVQDRVKGFEDAMKKYPGITIVGEAVGGRPARRKPRRSWKTCCRRTAIVTGVFGINDDSALGALGVVDAAGRKDIVDRRLRRDRRGAGGDQDAAARSRPTSCSTPHKIGQTAIDMIAEHARRQVGAHERRRSMSAS